MKYKVKYFDGPGCKWEKIVGLETDQEVPLEEINKWIPYIMGLGLNVMFYQPNPGEFIMWIDEKRFQQR